ncbi:MAG: hypothetical protein QOG38_3587 [Hyphomicrobiales bacterium]|nr:hypothetical protein [Hyphomicrobiales bacterium]
MGLFTPSARKSGIAQGLVREVHATVLQVFAYVGLFAALGLGVMEFATSPHLERAATKLLSSSVTTRADWIDSAQAPKLRGHE